MKDRDGNEEQSFKQRAELHRTALQGRVPREFTPVLGAGDTRKKVPQSGDFLADKAPTR